MNDLEELLIQFFASVADREKGAAFIEQHPERFEELFSLACSPKEERVHIVAAWVLEKYSLHQLEVLEIDLDSFIKGGGSRHESKRRPMMKLLYHYCLSQSRRSHLTPSQIDTIVAACFDYMLEAKKALP